MKQKTRLRLFTALFLLLSGCGSGEGPDALSNQTPPVSSGTFPDCISCHSAPVATRRQILGAGGDFGGNLQIKSHHVNGGDPSQAQCLVCHDLSAHTQGTVRLRHADTDARITYDPAAPSSLEPFCLSCHDADGALMTTIGPSALSPFDDGTVLGTIPYTASAKIKESWDKQYGHRRQGLTCLGTGQSGTGCHGKYDTLSGFGSLNAHGSGNVGLLGNKFTLPILSSAWDVSRYTLCLDCHNAHPSVLSISQLTGVADGGNYAQAQSNYTQWPYTVNFMVAGFHDYFSYQMDRQYNLHLYHLIEGMRQWHYRGTMNSIPSCIACHNVHGVDGQYYLWDEWHFSIEQALGVEYGKVNKTDVLGDFGCVWGVFCAPSLPANTPLYPEFCAANCHWDSKFRYPRSPFNEAKAVASDASGGPGLDDGDTVTIYFSDSTNGPAINEANISTVLALSGGHTWVDSNKGGEAGQLTAAWSDAVGRTNNVLTITIYIANPGAGDPTIAVNDSISFDSATITDANGIPVRGKMTLKGSF